MMKVNMERTVKSNDH